MLGTWLLLVLCAIAANIDVLADTTLTNLCGRKQYPTSCAEATANSRKSGTYTIQVDNYGPHPFHVVCDENHGGAWTVIQRRMDNSINFYRNWADYKKGFGNLEGEFFIGLDKLHALTNGEHPQELLFLMTDFEGERRNASYSAFAIGDESERYLLKTLGPYKGDAGDSFYPHVGQDFKTKDVNDTENCSNRFKGAWWYKTCHTSNLNGLYLKGKYEQAQFGQGINWFSWHGHLYSLKFVQMMIRPQRI